MEKTIVQCNYYKKNLTVDKPSGFLSMEEALALKNYKQVPCQEILINNPSNSFYLDEQIPKILIKEKGKSIIRIKRLMDISLSLSALIIGFPFLAIIALMIKLTSKGPIFYCQTRTGLRGKEFKIYKFRTMHVDSDTKKEELMDLNEMDGPVFKIKDDPRITRFGNFLRRSSIDEFPQFFNVLFNDMSVVGPRPPLPEEVKKYKNWQLRRISIKPGITCIWQVSGRNDIGFEEWMKMDLRYIDTWSFKLDFLILLKTFKTVLSLNGR